MKLKHLLSAALLTPVMLTSCIDNGWDLDNLDLTLGTNADITLPTSSTAIITLRNILDLEEDGVVQIVNTPDGDIYAVTQDGSTDVDPVKVDPISISCPDITPISVNINRTELGLGSAHKAPARKTLKINLDRVVPGLGVVEVTLPTQAYGYNIKPEDKTNYVLNNATATDITPDVEDIYSARVDNATTAYIDLGDDRIDFGYADQIDYVHFDNIVISLPKGLTATDAHFIYNGKSHDVIKIDNSQSRIYVTGSESEPINIHQTIRFELKFDAINFGQDVVFTKNANGNGQVDVKGEFRIDGGFRIITSEMTEADIQRHLDQLSNEQILSMWDGSHVNLDLDAIGLIPDHIHVDGKAEFVSNIDITSVSGRVLHHVDNIEPITLDDLPDFLNDDDVVLDLDNPLLFIDLDNQLPANITIGSQASDNGVLLSADTDKGHKQYHTGMLSVAPGSNLFMMADHATNVVPAKYAQRDIKYVEVKDLPGLVRRIPDQIDITIDPVHVDVNDLILGQEYPINIDYEIYAPLEFGDDFRLVYQDTERGWAKDLDDADTFDAGYIQLTGKVDSDLPADITLSLIPIDTAGERIKALKEVSFTVPARAKDKDISINLQPTAGHTINDIITGSNGAQQLDGMTYRAEVVKGQGAQAALRPDANIQLKNVKITIKGGISFDAN